MNQNDIGEVVSKIMEIVTYFRTHPVDTMPGEEMTRAAAKLAALKATLGQEVAETQYRVSFQEAERKHLWTQAFARAKGATDPESGKLPTDTVARNAADDLVHPEVLEGIEMQRELDLLKNLRSDSADLITTIQSRVGQLKQEMRDSFLQAGK